MSPTRTLVFALVALFLPLFALAQTNNTSANATTPSQTVFVSQSLTTTFSIGPDRSISEITRTINVTITSNIALPTGNATNSNSTASNNTQSASTTTTPKNLPTAATTIDGGGQGGAPFPGASAAGGIFGPDDGYIAAAHSLKRNALAVGLASVMLGGALLVL